MKKTIAIIIFLIGSFGFSQTDVDVTYVDGVAFKNLTTTELNAIATKVEGDTYYDTTKKTLVFWADGEWKTTGGVIEWDDVLSKPANLDIDSTDDVDLTSDQTITGEKIYQVPSGSGPIFNNTDGTNSMTVYWPNNNTWSLKPGGSSATLGFNYLLDKWVLPNNTLLNKSTPTLDAEPTSKKYVDDAISSSIDLIDDDTFATATSTNVPSAESVKAYVDDVDSENLKKNITNVVTSLTSISSNDGQSVVISPSANTAKISGGLASNNSVSEFELGENSIDVNIKSNLVYHFRSDGDAVDDEDVVRKSSLDDAISGIGGTDDQDADEVEVSATPSNYTPTASGTTVEAHLSGIDTALGSVGGSDLVDDLTPQLGGDLDTNSKHIAGHLIPSTSSIYTIGDGGHRWGAGNFNSLDILNSIIMNPTDTEPGTLEGMWYNDDSENRPKYYDGTSWKAFLLDGDVSSGSTDAVDIDITDTNDNFTATDVEGALEELAENTGIQSNISGEPSGSSAITNMVEIDYDDYVAGSPVAGTKYLVNDAPPVEEYTSATAVPLDGQYYGDMSTANSAIAYTTDASRRLRGGWAKYWINTTTLPTVDGDSANYDDGATWVSGDDFWLVIWYDGINVKKFLLNKL